MSFVKVANLKDVPEGDSIEVRIKGRELALFNLAGKFYCLDNSCPHMEGPLTEGYIEGETVICPWHAWPINIKTGEVTFNPDLCAMSYTVKVEDDAVLIDF